MAKIGSNNPIQAPEQWAQIVLAGVTSPGVCEVKEWKRHHEWDIKKGRGAFGATLTYTQRPPIKGTIEFKLWTPAHFAAWDDFYPLFHYDPTKSGNQVVKGISIYHPALAALDIKSVVTEFISNPVHKGEGLYEISVELIEFFKPPPGSAISTAEGSKDGAKKKPGVEDILDQALLDTAAELQKPDPQQGIGFNAISKAGGVF